MILPRFKSLIYFQFSPPGGKQCLLWMSQSNQLVQYTHYHNFNSLIKPLHSPPYTFHLTLSFLHLPSYTFKCLFILTFLTCFLTLAFILSPYYIYSLSYAFSHLNFCTLDPYLQFIYAQLLLLILAFINLLFILAFILTFLQSYSSTFTWPLILILTSLKLYLPS